MVIEKNVCHGFVFLRVLPEPEKGPCKIALKIAAFPVISIERPDVEEVVIVMPVLQIVWRKEQKHRSIGELRLRIAPAVIKWNQPGTLFLPFLSPAVKKEEGILFRKSGAAVACIHKKRSDEKAFHIPVPLCVNSVKGNNVKVAILS